MEKKATLKPVLVKIHPEFAGQRIDNYLITHLKGVPKSHIYRILRKGEVRVNKGRKKAHYRLQADDVVRIPPIRIAESTTPIRPGEKLRQDLESAILYEDSSLLIINKPVNMAVHGGSGIKLGLIEAMREIRAGIHYLELVHRLDRDTSGCLVLAKKRSALRALHEGLRVKQWRKRYVCLVAGQFEGNKRRIDLPLIKYALSSGERLVKVHPDGKASSTKFSIISTQAHCSLLQADLLTGRTHQIRVHCQSMSHAIVGDNRYGDKETNQWARENGLRRMFLHAHELRIPLPGSGEMLNITAPLDQELLHFMDKIGCNRRAFKSL
ncbi:MAG: RluA family pseudouridine synthase [Thiohalomonadales bacterium]